MYAEPADLDRAELVRTLRIDWGIEVTALRYEPVGFGTHHYRVRDAASLDWFVNVDELAAKPWLGASEQQALTGLEQSLATAAALSEAGLEFVHAPIRRPTGGCVAGMAGGYAVSVFGFIDGTSHPFGEFPTDGERRLVLAALGRMHEATPKIPPGLPRRDSLQVPQRDQLGEALRDLQTPWTAGPYGESARLLVRASTDRIDAMFARFDKLVPAVNAGSDGWVVTHGEPHAGNVMRTGDRAIKLIDWDTATLGPRERDLWMIRPRGDDDWAAYGQASAMDADAAELYRLRWHLADICDFITTLRAPHVDDENTRIASRELRNYLANDPAS